MVTKKKISNIKYTLESVSYICPECHKIIKKSDKFWVPCNIDKWGSSYTNICPHCKYIFDKAKLLIFPHIEQYLKDCDPKLKVLLDYCTDININANDFFGWACSDDEEFDCEMIAFYLALTFVEKMNPEKVMEALIEWHRGYLRYRKKISSKELRQIRKLTGWKWYPNSENGKKLIKVL